MQNILQKVLEKLQKSINFTRKLGSLSLLNLDFELDNTLI